MAASDIIFLGIGGGDDDQIDAFMLFGLTDGVSAVTGASGGRAGGPSRSRPLGDTRFRITRRKRREIMQVIEAQRRENTRLRQTIIRITTDSLTDVARITAFDFQKGSKNTFLKKDTKRKVRLTPLSLRSIVKDAL